MIQPTIREENGAIIFEWSGGLTIEARKPERGRFGLRAELRVTDLACEESPLVGLATVALDNLRDRKEFLQALIRRDGRIPDWDAHLLLVADHLSRSLPEQAGPAAASPGIRANTIQQETVQWLWPNRIPAGRFTLFAGDPDVGKSMLTTDLGARASVGGPWPDGGNAPLGRVLMLTAEDNLADTVVPRLDRHGADLSRIQLIGPQDYLGYALPDGLVPLEERIRELQDEPGDCVVVVLDPIECFLMGVDTHRTPEVRAAIAPLEALAERSGAAIVGILHLNKRSQETVAIYRFGGSLAFVAAARAALVVALDPEDITEDPNKRRRVFASAKSNLGPKPTPLAYHIIEPGVIRWEGTIQRSVSALLQSPIADTSAPQRAEAEGFLGMLLSDGPVASRQVAAEARDAGIAMKTLERAKDSLGVEVYREGQPGRKGGGRWYWTLDGLDRHEEGGLARTRA